MRAGAARVGTADQTGGDPVAADSAGGVPVPGSDRPLVEAVLRALRLLDCFDRGCPEMTLAEFVRRSGYSKTTTHRLLTTLEYAGGSNEARAAPSA